MSRTAAYIFPSQVPVTPSLRQACLLSPHVRLLLDVASDAVDRDLGAVLENGDEEQLQDPRFRRPLIGAIALAGYQQDVHTSGRQPVVVTGMSLGCLTAAAAVGFMSFEDMVRASHLMAEIEIQHFKGSGYLSVFFLNGDHERVWHELRTDGLDHLLRLSAIASGNQFLAAANQGDLERMTAAFVRAGALCRPIPHSYPGHCDLMRPVQDQFAREWAPMDPIGNTTLPVVDINSLRPTTSAEQIRRLVVEQYTRVLDWQGVLGYLEGLALDDYVVLEPSSFVATSMRLDPDCAIDPVVAGVGGGCV